MRPNSTASLWLRGGVALSPEDQVVTYSVRNLEPYRGFHVFMRALPELLQRCPKAHVVIVGGDAISYGRPPPQGCWREHMVAELAGKLDLGRVHFVGWLPYEQYLTVLQVSTAHVYLTYPFVLSWGLVEAMAAGCLVIASRTPPVEEVIDGKKNGQLFDFFDRAGLVDRVCAALEDKKSTQEMRTNARRFAVEHFDLNTVTLPGHLGLIHRLTGVDPVPRQRQRRSGASPALAATAR